jgi:hypothetical protein
VTNGELTENFTTKPMPNHVITISRLFHKQVCSNATADEVVAWVNSMEMGSGVWQLATPEQMHNYGNDDSNPVNCSEFPGKKHYLVVVEGFFE